MYKVKYQLAPSVIRNLFINVGDIHSHNTRQFHGFYIQKYRTNLKKFSMACHGPSIWQNIPIYIQKATSIHKFKKYLKQYILDEQ